MLDKMQLNEFYHNTNFMNFCRFLWHARSVKLTCKEGRRKGRASRREHEREPGKSRQCEKACKGIRGLSSFKRRLCDTNKRRQEGKAEAGWARKEKEEEWDRRTQASKIQWIRKCERQDDHRGWRKDPFKLLKFVGNLWCNLEWWTSEFPFTSGRNYSFCLFMVGDDFRDETMQFKVLSRIAILLSVADEISFDIA